MRRTVSAVEARKKLGEILEGVLYRDDRVIIERAGKPMAVVIPTWLYDNIERGRDRLMELIDKAQEANRDVPEEVLNREIEEAIREVREARRAKKPA